LVVDASGKVTDHKGAMTEIKTNRWGVCDNISHMVVKASAANKTSLKEKKSRKKQQRKKGKEAQKMKSRDAL
jgi:hypothetical protein